jgi:ADP-ribosylglycohydrolase
MKAWEIDRQIRLSAIPVDRRIESSHWYNSQTVFPSGDDLIALFWSARVPGSGAPEIPYVEMVESMANRGYEMSAAEALLAEGLSLTKSGDRDQLRALTARLLATIHSAPPDPASPYWQYEHPQTWPEVLAAMDPVSAVNSNQEPSALSNLDEKIRSGWQGQLAGGAFGTAIEGYHSNQVAAVYGEIDSYVTEPETINDDVTYELVFLDVFERLGRNLTPVEIGLEWVRQIPFGWSAEWVALHNFNDGILPPESGRIRNPYSEWIGAQMRGMICGMLAPGWPIEAARLAYIDSCVSHASNGIYGGIFAAVLTSLAFIRSEPHSLIIESLSYLPQRSEYVAMARGCLEVLHTEADPRRAWQILDTRFEQYNWIHAYPNLAADLLALWHCENDLTTAFKWLAHAGLDVDCNAGLVGNVLGVMYGVPETWSTPLHDNLETYLKGKEHLSIHELAARTALLAIR